MKTVDQKPIQTAANYSPQPLWPELGPEFYDPVKPAHFPKAILRYRNQEWAEKIGLGTLSNEDWQRAFWSFEPLPNNLPEPLALRYHGHQFMHYNPDLGDGRGFLYAELKEPNTERILDLGTKGSGQTPWSRRGDGRLTLKGAMREALATGMLEALQVNTSKTFSIFETGENLERGDEPSPTRSAVLTRLSHGHVRFGTFQRLAFLDDKKGMEKLFHFCCRHYYPHLGTNGTPNSVENTISAQSLSDFFKAVSTSVGRTTARQMLSGFVHGVLNTDNINITGESFDYGPYRFLPYYDISFTAAYFDRSGLYAYGQQPRILIWNLQQLQAALELIAPTGLDMEEVFAPGYQAYQQNFSLETFQFFLQRLNLKDPQQTDSDDITAPIEKLFLSWVGFMEKNKVPFEGFFFDWFGGKVREQKALSGPRKEFYQGPEFEKFHGALADFVPINESVLENIYFSEESPVHLHIDEIERIWSRIDQFDDWSAFEEKIEDFAKIKTIYSQLDN
jgi:serine/tyrosine/threonine adenylyltransferase